MMIKKLLSLISISFIVAACNGDSDQDSNQGGDANAGGSDAEPGAVSSQVDLPDELNISSDGERLERGGIFVTEFYDEDVLETIYIDFDQENYQVLLEENYPSRTEIEARLTYKDVVYDSVGVRYRGATSYFLAGDKKSFSVDLEWAIDGQDINGYNSLKLNNGYEDPSAMREVLYSSLARSHIPAAKVNFIKLVVNGESYGVYSNVQKLRKDHVNEWFFDNDATRWRAEAEGSGMPEFSGPPPDCPEFPDCPGGPDIPQDIDFADVFAGTSSLNNLGPSGSDYETAYELRSSDVDDPWQDLANAAYTLDTADPDTLVDELGQYLDIDETLWFIATENLFTDPDSYVNKGGVDYYLYFDLASSRLLPIEYDGNSAMSDTDWSPFFREDDERFPLISVLLNIPELRQRYLAHYRALVSESLDLDLVNEKITTYASLINDVVADEDQVRQYTYEEYVTAVEELRNYFSERRDFVTANAEVAQLPPVISEVTDLVNGTPSIRPSSDQSVVVNAQVDGEEGVEQVILYYSNELAGSFVKSVMNDQGGGQYTVEIPPQPSGAFVRYYVEAISANSAKTAAYSPPGAEHDVYIYQVIAAESISSNVVINEIMPSNDSTITDQDGEYGDWIELFNNGDSEVDLSGYYLTDEDTNLTRWAFPEGVSIGAKSTLVVWADDKPSSAAELHANFRLSASGENVYLVTPDLEFADSLSFGEAVADESFARLPNGVGEFSWTQSPTFNAENN